MRQGCVVKDRWLARRINNWQREIEGGRGKERGGGREREREREGERERVQ
jgi:hypothetical protein